MSEVVVLAEDETRVGGAISESGVEVDAAGLAAAIGWELKPEGLCRDEVCIPVSDPASLALGDGYDLTAVAKAIGATALVDTDLGVVAVSQPKAQRNVAVHDMMAPELVLPDLDGNQVSTAGFKGRKKMLVVFASW